jgi:hypothetical protein
MLPGSNARFCAERNQRLTVYWRILGPDAASEAVGEGKLSIVPME